MQRCLGLMLLVIITTAILTGCGGDSSGPIEENLKDRAEAFGTAIVNGDYSGIWEVSGPEFQSICSKEEYVSRANAAIMAEAVSMGLDEDATPKQVIRAGMGVDGDADVKVRASDVEVAGNQGTVLIEFYQDDVRFAGLGGDDGDIWMFTDGQWHLDGVIPSGGC